MSGEKCPDKIRYRNPVEIWKKIPSEINASVIEI